MSYNTEGPSSVWAWARGLGTVMVLLFLIFLSIGGVGAYQGLQKRAALLREVASEHYARGLAYMQDDRYELAIAEFEMALQFDPSIEGAQARLVEAQRRSQFKLATPTPTPQPEKPITDQLYIQAQSCYENGDLKGALAALKELRAIDPDYKAEEVAHLLYDVFYQQGQALAAEDRLEEALRSFDQALAWRPEDKEALEQRKKLSLYLAGLGFWEADWAQATETFAQLHALDANYRDVADRLYKAQLAYGDYAAEEGDWCLAESQYAQTLELRDDPEVQRKRGEASERCAMASAPSPIQAATSLTVTEEQPASEQGTLALTLYDPQLEKPALYLVRFDPTGGPRWVRLREGFSQPAFSPDGELLAVRSSAAGQEGLCIIDRKGRVVTPLPGTARGMKPTWSPDGQSIAFVVAGDDLHSGRIYTVPANGQGEPREVASGYAPAWGPQGWFAFTGCEGEECGIIVRSPDVEEGVRITASPQDIGLAWSPDAQKLAYMSDHDGDWEVHITTRRGWVQQLTVNEAQDGLPTWSPDGSELAFVSNWDGDWGLYVMRPDGSGLRKLFILGYSYYNDYNGRWEQAQIAWGP
ncbi:MAG: tetratricopeptide repeat protein [Chloroflexota bacterium]|nr:tetratricopeptide repeat protein [Chloroflexota bacterium]